MIKAEKKVPIGIRTRAFCATNRRTNHYTIETTTKNENEKITLYLKNVSAGNRTQIFCVTGRDTNHYTTATK